MAELRLFGCAAAPGTASGVVHVLRTSLPIRRPARTQAEERADLVGAVSLAHREVVTQRAHAPRLAAEMLSFQAEMLADPELARPALMAVAAGASAMMAWDAAMRAEIATYAGADDAIFAGRTADLEDIRDRVMRHLSPDMSGMEVPPPGTVIVASDLTLSRFLALDWRQGGAIILTQGSASSHVAMLARAWSIPMVVGLGGAAQALIGREALVDATAGEVVLDPKDASRIAFSVRTRRALAEDAHTHGFRAGPAVTADGTRIAVHLNVGALAELDGLDPAICDGIGLVRTELLLHGTGGLLDEAAQYAAYCRIAAWAGGRPVVVRTLDAGGDKPILGVTLEGESNPFLGLRGVRLTLRAPGLFRLQLRALARAAARMDVRVLLPMVTVPEEVTATRALLDEAVAGLTRDGVPARRPLLGIMIEVPAAAIAIDLFDVDFYSIGSNDLIQYVTAAGRDISSVANLADPLNPAVLRLIRAITQHGETCRREVSLCGDAAADPRCIEALLRAGMRSLSVAPGAVGRVKQTIAAIDLGRPAP